MLKELLRNRAKQYMRGTLTQKTYITPSEYRSGVRVKTDFATNKLAATTSVSIKTNQHACSGCRKCFNDATISSTAAPLGIFTQLILFVPEP